MEQMPLIINIKLKIKGEKMSKKLEQKLIDFQGGQILGFKTEDGQIYLGVKKACIDIGLTDGQARRQVENITEDLALKQGIANLRLPTNGGTQEVLVVKEDFVTLWLAKISLTPKMQKENPKAVEKLVNYQLKCAKVLHNAFMATEEQRQEFYSEMGLKGQIVELNEKLDNTIIKLNSLIDSSTINSRQSQKLLTSARERVSTILGGSHSELYKKESRMYFSNLWNSFGKYFETSSYKDLNPVHFSDGFTFISHWSMT